MTPRLRLGLLLGVLVVVGVVALWMLSQSAESDLGPGVVAPATKGRITFLALGDSYTIGQGVAADDRWPNALARLVRAGGVDLSDPAILARSGWRTSQLLAAMERANLPEFFDLVTILIGANDQFSGAIVESFRQDLDALLPRAIRLARGRPERVLIVSIPDWSRTPFAGGHGADAARIAREIEAYNAALRAAAKHWKVGYLEIDSKHRPTDRTVVSDGLHPNAALYRTWAEAAVSDAMRRLR